MIYKMFNLKKETFIKIVLPLIVAENEKILDDREKLKKIKIEEIYLRFREAMVKTKTFGI